MDKLREKRQSKKQRKQAHHAAELYFELVFRSVKKRANNEAREQKGTGEQTVRTRKELFSQENKQLECISTVNRGPEPTKHKTLKSSGTDWTAIYSGLENAMKIRHYSHLPLKMYMSWTHKFQTYTGSKDSCLLMVEDVKAF